MQKSWNAGAAADAGGARPRAINPPVLLLLLPPRVGWSGFVLRTGAVGATQDHNRSLDFSGGAGVAAARLGPVVNGVVTAPATGLQQPPP